MSNKAVEAIESIAKRLVGLPCWATYAGGCTGSHFSMAFGDKFKRLRELTNSTLSSLERQYDGEFGIFVQCAAWRLDSQSKVITSSTDDSSPDGPMVSGLKELKSRVVTNVLLMQPGLDLVVEFDASYWLRVFCDQFSHSNYSLNHRKLYVSVGARSTVKSEDGNSTGSNNQSVL